MHAGVGTVTDRLAGAGSSAPGFPVGSGQETTVNIKDRFHHRKLGVGRANLPAKLDELNRRMR